MINCNTCPSTNGPNNVAKRGRNEAAALTWTPVLLTADPPWPDVDPEQNNRKVSEKLRKEEQEQEHETGKAIKSKPYSTR